LDRPRPEIRKKLILKQGYKTYLGFKTERDS